MYFMVNTAFVNYLDSLDNLTIISLPVTKIVINVFCKHKQLKTLIASLALQQIKEVGLVATQEPL